MSDNATSTTGGGVVVLPGANDEQKSVSSVMLSLVSEPAIIASLIIFSCCVIAAILLAFRRKRLEQRKPSCALTFDPVATQAQTSVQVSNENELSDDETHECADEDDNTIDSSAKKKKNAQTLLGSRVAFAETVAEPMDEQKALKTEDSPSFNTHKLSPNRIITSSVKLLHYKNDRQSLHGSDKSAESDSTSRSSKASRTKEGQPSEQDLDFRDQSKSDSSSNISEYQVLDNSSDEPMRDARKMSVDLVWVHDAGQAEPSRTELVRQHGTLRSSVTISPRSKTLQSANNFNA